MNTNIGKLTATLSKTEKNKIDDLIKILNANIKPDVRLTNDDVHIRCMYIVSEELNSYGGKFPLEELNRIKELIVDSPVLIGHKKDQLPIGRNFYAEVVFKDNTHWVKSYFYWMKSADNAVDLQKNIDGGVIKECSIGFTFFRPECSICNNDIRTCRHEPFSSYTKDGVTQACYFNYREVDNVLETSLVYRGAVPNTSISNELQSSEGGLTIEAIEYIKSLDELTDQSTYLVTPMYIGQDISLTTTHNRIEIQSFGDINIPRDIIKKFFREYPKNLENHYGQLIGYRGKERCSLDELQKYLSGEKSIVRRIELRLFPTYDILKTDCQNIKVMRYKIAQKEEIQELSKLIMTRDGIRIFSLHNQPPAHFGYLYDPLNKNQPHRSYKQEYTITYDSNQNTALSLYYGSDETHYLIKRFNEKKFSMGKRFLAEKIQKDKSVLINQTKYNSGRLNIILDSNDFLQLELESYLQNKITIQPIILNGKEQYLLYKSI